MSALVYLPLLVPVLAAAAARPLAARLEPRLATWLLTATTVALAAFSTAALALMTASALARSPLLAALGDYSQPVLRRGDPVPALAGMAAALLLTAAAVAVAVVIRARARALAESYRRAASMAPDGRVVVVPGHSIEAYALPGSPGRIVVSGRLLDVLNDRGRAALLAMSTRTWPAGITCSPAWRTSPPRPTRCCSRWPARWTTPWSAGPTSAPPPSPATAVWWPAPSARSPCSPPPPARPACGRRSPSPVPVPDPSRWPGPARCPGGSPPCSPRPRAASWPCWPLSLS